ncbi:MAG: LPS assembly lipoprotein LptE [Pseudomonadota bacterium]
MKVLRLAAAFSLSLWLCACGFKPIYATQEGASPVSRLVAVGPVAAPETVAPYVADALDARLGSVNGETPRYDLLVTAQEAAERLAVQIDATVTRYNYRLSARYRVIDRETGEGFSGVARAVTSYNIVNSQYSTLFAERTAVEKAARQLAEEIERDLLIRFAEPEEERNKVDPRNYETVLDPSEILIEPRRGEVIEPIFDDADLVVPDPVESSPIESGPAGGPSNPVDE